jgi:hypothetical protein
MEHAMTKQKKTASKITDGTRAAKKKPAAVATGTSKVKQLEALLRRPATLGQISASIGWQAHSVRGAMSGTLKKKQGLTITSDKAQDGQRVYRIAI